MKLIPSHGEFEPEGLRYAMRLVARVIRDDEATSWTGEEMFAALDELADAAGHMRSAAGEIRGGRPPAASAVRAASATHRRSRVRAEGG